ncbi:MAG: antitoxin family protein [Thermodesulfobacteriota bacterium]
MHKVIEAIYENGVLKPLTRLDIKEHEKVQIIIKENTSLTKMSQGIVKGNSEVIEDVSLNPEYTCLEE